MTVYGETDFEEMSDEGLAKCIELLWYGREYDGIETDRKRCIDEVIKRLE